MRIRHIQVTPAEAAEVVYPGLGFSDQFPWTSLLYLLVFMGSVLFRAPVQMIKMLLEV
jgi:hypothetical protein